MIQGEGAVWPETLADESDGERGFMVRGKF
jgi:hypothetical protein